MRTQYLVGISNRDRRDVLFKTEAGVEVDRYDGAELYETEINPRWASLEPVPAALEQQVLEIEGQGLEAAERLSKLSALLEDAPSRLVVQGWYYVERIVYLSQSIVRIAYPLMGRASATPFDIVIEPGQPSEVQVRDIPPEILYAEAMPAGKGTIGINWGAKHVGFGQLYLAVSEGGKASLSTETMSRDFVKQVLGKLVDDAEIDD